MGRNVSGNATSLRCDGELDGLCCVGGLRMGTRACAGNISFGGELVKARTKEFEQIMSNVKKIAQVMLHTERGEHGYLQEIGWVVFAVLEDCAWERALAQEVFRLYGGVGSAESEN